MRNFTLPNHSFGTCNEHIFALAKIKFRKVNVVCERSDIIISHPDEVRPEDVRDFMFEVNQLVRGE